MLVLGPDKMFTPSKIYASNCTLGDPPSKTKGTRIWHLLDIQKLSNFGGIFLEVHSEIGNSNINIYNSIYIYIDGWIDR